MEQESNKRDVFMGGILGFGRNLVPEEPTKMTLTKTPNNGGEGA